MLLALLFSISLVQNAAIDEDAGGALCAVELYDGGVDDDTRNR